MPEGPDGAGAGGAGAGGIANEQANNREQAAQRAWENQVRVDQAREAAQRAMRRRGGGRGRAAGRQAAAINQGIADALGGVTATTPGNAMAANLMRTLIQQQQQNNRQAQATIARRQEILQRQAFQAQQQNQREAQTNKRAAARKKK